jgi:hypothetical protein
MLYTTGTEQSGESSVTMPVLFVQPCTCMHSHSVYSHSAVVHQFDRHKELSDYFYKALTSRFLKEWRERQKTA